MHHEIAAERLHNQFIARRLRADPARLVARLGAVQAQEYPFAKWGLALRLAGEQTDAGIDAACDAGRILRTHVLRPTWHFVARDDIRWMLELTGPRVQRTVTRYTRRVGIDAATLRRAATMFERALAGGASLTRADLGARLARRGIALSAPHLAFVTMYAELEGIVCSGPRRGRQFTYALVSDRAPAAARLPRDEALSTLTRRYYTSHGPATIRDFVWWSGLTVADTRRGLDMNRAKRQTIDGVDYWRIGRSVETPAADHVQLLPIYDEYLVAYRDRVAVPHGPGTLAAPSESVTFRHAFISRGQVAGTWNVSRAAGRCAIRVTPMRRLSSGERRAVGEAAERFAHFLDCPVSIAFG
jgi:hypothetical protein